MEELKQFFSNVFNFHGRTRRREYFIGTMFGIAIMYTAFALAIASYAVHLILGIILTILTFIYMIFFCVGCLSCVIRRLHDAGKSGAYIFIQLIPLAGSFIMLYFLLKDSQYGENEWGPNPKSDAYDLYYGSAIPKAILSFIAFTLSIILFTASIIFTCFAMAKKMGVDVSGEGFSYHYSSTEENNPDVEETLPTLSEENIMETDSLPQTSESMENEEDISYFELDKSGSNKAPNIPDSDVADSILEQTWKTGNKIGDETFSVLIFDKESITPEDFSERYGNSLTESDVLNTIDTFDRFTPYSLIDYCGTHFNSMYESDWIGVRLVIMEGIISEEDLLKAGVPEKYLYE